MIRETYMNKANRDKRWVELIEQGIKVERSSINGQNCHPMYVKDYESETGHILTQADKGFGNTIYGTYFSKLYIVEEVGRHAEPFHGAY